MTCALCWKPVSQESNSAGSYQLRDILEKKYGYPNTLDYSHLEYLRALQDSGVEGADILIEAIELYNVIEIYKEC